MRFAVVIEKAERNFSAYVPDLPGCVATGATVEDVEREISEAIAFHPEGMREDGLPIPDPTSKVEYIELAAWLPIRPAQPWCCLTLHAQPDVQHRSSPGSHFILARPLHAAARRLASRQAHRGACCRIVSHVIHSMGDRGSSDAHLCSLVFWLARSCRQGAHRHPNPQTIAR
jgi:predicted RNase H-like HicB family nuclease